MKLTIRQKMFIELYSGNATEAAKLAGYSEKTARVQGGRLLLNVAIRHALERRMIHRDGVHIATREERQKFWAETMNNPSLDHNIRLRASELLGKSQADFTENVNVSGELDVFNVVNKLDLEAITILKNRMLQETNVSLSHN